MKKFLLGLFLISALPVNAASFGNGDFSSGGTLWNTIADNGSVNIAGGQAVLETFSGQSVLAPAATLLQGDDGNFWSSLGVDPFTLAVDANWLLFDAIFENLGRDGSESGGSLFSDALLVSLYDYDDVTGGMDLYFDPVIDSSVDGLLLSYALDVSSLKGRNIALSFELYDEDDLRDSRVTLDNVQFVASLPVPEPSALVLLLAGLPLLRLCTRQKRA